jgi:hypothetical protein
MSERHAPLAGTERTVAYRMGAHRVRDCKCGDPRCAFYYAPGTKNPGTGDWKMYTPRLR